MRRNLDPDERAPQPGLELRSQTALVPTDVRPDRVGRPAPFRAQRSPIERGALDDPALTAAVIGLARERPLASAYHGLWGWQLFALVAGGGSLLAATLIDAPATGTVVLAAFAIVFALATLLRTHALIGFLAGRRPRGPRPLTDEELPTYAVFVPVFRETEIIADLVATLSAIDYPTAKLDVVFVCEAHDPGSVEALAGHGLPKHMRILVVPHHIPRTKPKALNYALAGTTADYVVIFDAEDCPPPDQLRQAAALFYELDDQVGCLQARLNVYNWRDGWLTRHFALEYSALFDAFLPSLERLGLPIPLGGTSNHFPRRALVDVGAWDPWNVTEDADLGFRLSRAGYRICMLESTTWEEAPVRFSAWLSQRTRWMKGWFQTFAVHTRQPAVLVGDFGLYRFSGFVLLMGGLLGAVLCWPLFVVMLAYELFQPVPFAANTMTERLIWVGAGLNFAIGLLVTVALSAATAAARGRWSLWASLPTLPFYWLLMSLAAYRALWQLITDPSGWEKTTHRARRASDDLRR
ncbi:MAG: glycosyltransferase [Pseudomonadota bacterium]